MCIIASCTYTQNLIARSNPLSCGGASIEHRRHEYPDVITASQSDTDVAVFNKLHCVRIGPVKQQAQSQHLRMHCTNTSASIT